MKRKLLSKLVLGGLIVFTIGALGGCNLNRKKEFNSTDVTKTVSAANNVMGFDLFKVIDKTSKGQNVVISPISLSMIMSLVQNGAVDNTKTELLNFLQLSNTSDGDINNTNKELLEYYYSLSQRDNIINFGNSLWIDKGFDVEKEFKSIARDFYDATIKNVDFSKDSTIKEMNKWVHKNTNGKIEEMVTELNPNDKLILLNTLYMNSKWVNPFDKEKNQNGVFKRADGQVEMVEYMVNQNEFKYGKFEDYQIAQMPYELEGFTMNIILPNSDLNINDFVNSFDNDKLTTSLATLQNTQLDIRLPKFKVEYENQLNDELKLLGVKDAFNDKANFTKIADGLYISEILQKTYIDVNETGTEAAAATKVQMTKTSMPQYTIFEVNRPFIFTIYDEKTNEIMFLGKIETIK